MKTLKIQTADNPERYQYFDGEFVYICQVEDNEYSLSIIKSRHTKKIAEKAKVLYEGNTDDFCYEYDGKIEHGGLDVEMAFRNFLTSQIIL